MQRVFLCCLVCVIGTLMFVIVSDLTFKDDSLPDTIRVSLVYQGETEIYELEPYSTVNDLLNMTHKSFIYDEGKVNLNMILSNRDVINLPEKTVTQCISINTASQSELVSLKGVGESVAVKIIDFRNEFGAFQNLEDLMLVSGIGPAKFEGIKDSICL